MESSREATKKYLKAKIMSNTKTKLDDYEQEILELYEDGRLKPVPDKTDYQTIARTTLKNKNWCIRFQRRECLRC